MYTYPTLTRQSALARYSIVQRLLWHAKPWMLCLSPVSASVLIALGFTLTMTVSASIIVGTLLAGLFTNILLAGPLLHWLFKRRQTNPENGNLISQNGSSLAITGTALPKDSEAPHYLNLLRNGLSKVNPSTAALVENVGEVLIRKLMETEIGIQELQNSRARLARLKHPEGEKLLQKLDASCQNLQEQAAYTRGQLEQLHAHMIALPEIDSAAKLLERYGQTTSNEDFARDALERMEAQIAGLVQIAEKTP